MLHLHDLYERHLLVSDFWALSVDDLGPHVLTLIILDVFVFRRRYCMSSGMLNFVLGLFFTLKGIQWVLAVEWVFTRLLDRALALANDRNLAHGLALLLVPFILWFALDIASIRLKLNLNIFTVFRFLFLF
jgi:hypothetical protein